MPLLMAIASWRWAAYRYALDGVIDEHLLHQIDTICAQQRESGAQVLRTPLGEQVPVLELGHSRPHLLIGCAQQFEDVQQLLPLAVAR